MSKIADIGELQDRLTGIVKSDPQCSSARIYAEINRYMRDVGTEQIDVHLLRIHSRLTGQSGARERGDQRTIQACETLSAKLNEIEEIFGSTLTATFAPRFVYYAHSSSLAAKHFLSF